MYLSARLVSEPSATGRRRVASTVTGLLQRVTAERRRNLLDMTLTWLRGEDAAKKVRFCGLGVWVICHDDRGTK